MFLHRGIAANVDVVRSPLGAFLFAPGTMRLPSTLVKPDVFASGPRCYCKNIRFYGAQRKTGVPGANKKAPKTALTTGQR